MRVDDWADLFPVLSPRAPKLVITLRLSTHDDLPALHRIWRRSVEATHHFLTPAHLEMLSEIVRDYYLPTTIFLLAVDANDQPVAFLGGEGGTVEALFVDPDWFGKGVGRMLMTQALTRAPVLRLDVNEQNAQARGFYERLGFVAVGRSETDGAGLPYPLIHMEWRRP
jgi:putative acetyltransferase